MDELNIIERLLRIQEVAQLLGCSTRNVQRLIDARRMPQPVRLGGLLRWPASVVSAWIASGCPAPTSGSREEEKRHAS